MPDKPAGSALAPFPEPSEEPYGVAVNGKNLVAVPGGNTLPSAWITNALSDQFGRILNAGNMRQAEVAVRYVW